jgi:hypothetical protein
MINDDRLQNLDSLLYEEEVRLHDLINLGKAVIADRVVALSEEYY